MNIIEYKNIKETVFQEIFDNGLTLKIIPKKGYKKTFVCLGTNYGSLTNIFKPYNENDYQEMPLGIAHFLEHKMFEKEDESDVSNKFAELGLEVNAYTDYTETVYLFYGSSNLEEGINLLLDFVQKPYFNKESIENEKGIIKQELLMYLDSPKERLHNGLMENMFKKYPLRYDVGGTVESIYNITPELLYKCHNTFYHPSNMSLVIVGDVDPLYIRDIVLENQSKKQFINDLIIDRKFNFEDEMVNNKTSSINMDVVRPKVTIGIKLPHQEYQKNEAMMIELMLKIIMEIKIGPSSNYYQELIDNELISGGIGYSVFLDGNAGYLKLRADSNKPGELKEELKKFLLSLSNIKINEEEFLRFKKAVLGSFLKELNDPEFIATSFIEYDFKNCDLFSSISLIEELEIEDIKKMGNYFKEEALCDFTVYPQLWK